MAINEVAKATIYLDDKQAEAAMKSLNAQMDKWAKSMNEAKKANDKAGFDKAKKEYDSAKKSLGAFNKTVVDVTKVLNNLSGSSYNQLMKAQRSLEASIRGMNKNTKEEIALYNQKVAQLKRVKEATSSARSEMGMFRKASTNVTAGLRSVAGALGITGGVYMLVNAFKSMVQSSMEFEKSLSSLSAITGLVGKDLDYFKTQALDTSGKTLKSANEIVKAYELVGSIRPELLQNKEALAEVTKQAIILSEATGGKLGLEEAARATAGTLNQFSKESSDAAEVINVLAAGSKFGAAAVVDITASIDKFGAVADGANMSLEQTVGVIETLAEKSITGAEAGTKLRNIIIKLQADQSNYKDGVFDFNLALENLANANMDVTQLTQEFGKENIVAAQILVKSRQKVIDYTDAVTGTNTALEQQKIQNNNVSGALTKLSNSWDTFLLKLNTSNGALFENLRFINAILDAINKSEPKNDTELKLFNANGVINETALAKKSMEELDETLGTLTTDADLYFNNWKNKTGEERAFWAGQYDIAKQNIDLINKARLAAGNAEDGEGEGDATTPAVPTLEDYMKDHAKEFEAWKESREDFISKQEEFELGKKFSEESFQARLAAEKEQETRLQEEMAKWDAAMNQDFEMEDEEGFADDPAIIKQTIINQMELDLWAQTQEGKLAIAEQTMSKEEMMQKAHQYSMQKMDQETNKAKLQNAMQYVQMASQIANGLSMMYTMQMNKELKAAGDNEAQKEAIQQKYAKKQQNVAVMQAIMNGALSVMSMWATAPNPIIGAIYTAIVAGVTAMEVGVIKSQQFAEGNRMQVIGAQDGKTYNARIAPSNRTSGMVGEPTFIPGLGLVGETPTPELVFNPSDTQKIIDSPALIDAINMTLGSTPQFAQGNATEIIRENNTVTTTSDPAQIEAMNRFSSVVERMMNEGIEANLMANEDYIRKHKKVINEYDTFKSKVSG